MYALRGAASMRDPAPGSGKPDAGLVAGWNVKGLTTTAGRSPVIRTAPHGGSSDAVRMVLGAAYWMLLAWPAEVLV